MKATKRPVQAVSTWVRRQPPKIKVFLAVISGLAALVFLRMVVHDHDNLFVAAEAVHSIGISVLIYKLMKEKTCTGNGYDISLSFFYDYLKFIYFFLLIQFSKQLLVKCNWVFVCDVKGCEFSHFSSICDCKM